MRLRDTRMHCAFENNVNPIILRESCWREATFKALAAVSSSSMIVLLFLLMYRKKGSNSMITVKQIIQYFICDGVYYYLVFSTVVFYVETNYAFDLLISPTFLN